MDKKITDFSYISEIVEAISLSKNIKDSLNIISDALINFTKAQKLIICSFDDKEYGNFYILEERNMKNVISYIKKNYFFNEKNYIPLNNLPLYIKNMIDTNMPYCQRVIFEDIKDKNLTSLFEKENITSFYILPLISFSKMTSIIILGYVDNEIIDKRDMDIYKILTTILSDIMVIDSLGREVDTIIDKLKEAIISIEKISHILYENKGLSSFLKQITKDMSNIVKSEGTLILIDDKDFDIKAMESYGDSKKLESCLNYIKSNENEKKKAFNKKDMPKNLIEKGINTACYHKLIKDGMEIGYIILYNSAGYYDEDVRILEIFSIQIVLALYVFLNNKKMLEATILDRDLELISKQQKLIMDDEIKVRDDTIEMDYLNIPYRYVGGDFCKFQKISEKRYFLFIADVMGHGIISNYFVAMLKGALNTLLDITFSPSCIMNTLNRVLYKELDNLNMFITAKSILFDFENNKLYSSNAGHTMPIAIYKKTGNDWPHEVIKSESGIALGIIEDIEYEEEQKDITNLDLFAIYTDGIVEMKNKSGQEFGVDGLVDFLKTQVIIDSDEISHNLIKLLETHIGMSELQDDITIVTVRKK